MYFLLQIIGVVLFFFAMQQSVYAGLMLQKPQSGSMAERPAVQKMVVAFVFGLLAYLLSNVLTIAFVGFGRVFLAALIGSAIGVALVTMVAYRANPKRVEEAEKSSGLSSLFKPRK